jgi:hypothetical protein
MSGEPPPTGVVERNMIVRYPGLRLSMIGALASCVAASFIVALAASAAEPKPAESVCQKLTGADRTECERRVREQDVEHERAAAPQPEPDRNEPPPDTKSEGNDDSDTADPPRP